MKKSKIVGLLTGFLVTLAFGAGIAFQQGLLKAEKTLKEIPGLRLAPEFSLLSSGGKIINSKDLVGSVVLVHFWAAWCAPCIPEVPEFLSLAKKLPKNKEGKPIYWILISQDDSFEKTKKVLNPENLPENVFSLIDANAKVSDSFGSYQFPETYLITREGGVLTKWIGAQEWGTPWGDKIIEQIEEVSRKGVLPVLPPAQQKGS